MITITLQDDEAEKVERLLDLILTNKAASEVAFEDGAHRRCVLRVSKKIHWARCQKEN